MTVTVSTPYGMVTYRLTSSTDSWGVEILLEGHPCGSKAFSNREEAVAYINNQAKENMA